MSVRLCLHEYIGERVRLLGSTYVSTPGGYSDV
jgi:hypothetical protein